MRGVSVGALSLLVLGCSVNLNAEDSGTVVSNQCSSNSECAGGACWSGVCVAHEGTLSTVLLEVTPPTNAVGVGGARFLRLASGFSRSGEDHKLDLTSVGTVHGFVRAYDTKQNKACSAGESLPVEVTLTPQEQAYGLPSVAYVARTQLGAASSACAGALGSAATNSVYEFAIDLPTTGRTDATNPAAASTTGRYDVYIRPIEPDTRGADNPDAGVAPSACSLVPELLSGSSGLKVDPGVTCYAITPRVPQPLDVEIPWVASSPVLDGWGVDILHPITGQVLSGRRVIAKSDATSTGYKISLQYSQAITDDSTQSGQELLRLSPPKDLVAPTILLGLSGLIAATAPSASGARHAILPSFDPFQESVSLDYSVQRANRAIRVAASVTFSATKLDQVPYGVFASFSTSAVVDADGRFRVDVPPGTYRVRIVPDANQPQQDGVGLAAKEETVDVPCTSATAGSCLPITDRVFLVPTAASVTGKASSPFGVAGVERATVQALPGPVGRRACNDLPDASTCEQQQLGILDVALAEDAFVPRPATTVVAHGRFRIDGVDCGGCTADNSALFDVSVRPAGGSRLPWLVKPNIPIFGDFDLGQLDVSLPIVQRGVVEVPLQSAEPATIPGALISAYVVRDAQGAPIDDPSGLSTCTGSSTTRCIRSVLKVAETRSLDDGKFELLLPAALE